MEPQTELNINKANRCCYRYNCVTILPGLAYWWIETMYSENKPFENIQSEIVLYMGSRDKISFQNELEPL